MFYSEDEKMSGVRSAGLSITAPAAGHQEAAAGKLMRAARRARQLRGARGVVMPRPAPHPPAPAEDGHKIQIISRPQSSAQLTSPCTSTECDLWIYGE